MDSNVRSPGTVGDVEPSFGQELLDIAIAQSEAEIEPDRVLDDLRREAMAAVAERSHADIFPIRRRLPTGFRDNAVQRTGGRSECGFCPAS